MKVLDRAVRRRAVRFALRLTAGTTLAPDLQEKKLLQAYINGTLSLEQLVDLTGQYQRDQQPTEHVC